ncbi:hypothetical protein [Nocardioides ultimimeridianus]
MDTHRAAAAVLIVGTLAAGLSACGGSDTATPATSVTPSPTTSAADSALLDRLRAEQDFGSADGAPEMDTAAEFAAKAPGDEGTRLGVDGVGIQFLTVHGTGGMARVMHFGSARAAATYRDDERSMAKEVTTRTFPVPGVPGAIGFDQVPRAGATNTNHSLNVVFTIGGYEYYLGAALPPGGGPSRADIAAGARSWYAAAAGLG